MYLLPAKIRKGPRFVIETTASIEPLHFEQIPNSVNSWAPGKRQDGHLIGKISEEIVETKELNFTH